MKMRLTFLTLILSTLFTTAYSQPFKVLILGNAQDGGFPQIGCQKECCENSNISETKGYVTSLAIINTANNHVWLIDCTPDIKEQWNIIAEQTGNAFSLQGIFITHAHVGHYTGLQQFGREVMGAKSIKIYCMPRMKAFLEENGPWSQLVDLNNVQLSEINENQSINLEASLTIIPFLVPHRDEFSETVGYRIESKKQVLFIPDIDKWEQWNKSIVNEVKEVDIALLDATFYGQDELKGRDMSEIPHPFVVETMKTFNNEDSTTKSKIRFIHMNHSNPLLQRGREMEKVKEKGYNVAQTGDIIDLN